MKTDIHFWAYLAQFFLEWKIFQIKVVEEIKTHILYSVTFFLKTYRFWDNVEKYGRARQAMDDNIMRRTHFACWITKSTETYSEYVISYLLLFHRYSGCTNAPGYYVKRTWPVLSSLKCSSVDLLLRFTLNLEWHSKRWNDGLPWTLQWQFCSKRRWQMP